MQAKAKGPSRLDILASPRASSSLLAIQCRIMPDSIMRLRLHNSLTRRTEDFAPQDSSRVTLYLCGPTVYNYVHIGNARGPVVFGLLVRLLKRIYGPEHVVYARNVTDVDDKINAAAHEAGVPIDTIAQRYATAYGEDMVHLGV